MESKTVKIYFVDNSERYALFFGNNSDSANKIDDYQMKILESWIKRPIDVCCITNSKGVEFNIFPNNISYIEVIKNK